MEKEQKDQAVGSVGCQAKKEKMKNKESLSSGKEYNNCKKDNCSTRLLLMST